MGVSEDWQSSPIYGVPVQGNFVGKDDDKTVGLGVPCSDKPLICRRSFDVPTGKSTTWGTYRDVFLFF